MMNNYMKASGWTPAPGWALYDVGDPEVEQALKDGEPVPAGKARITEDDWTDGKWQEQPITRYMTTNPSDDFAEAIKTFLTRPGILRARSPHRFRFIDAHKPLWLPRLRKAPP